MEERSRAKWHEVSLESYDGEECSEGCSLYGGGLLEQTVVMNVAIDMVDLEQMSLSVSSRSMSWIEYEVKDEREETCLG